MKGLKSEKDAVRKRIWAFMEEKGVSRFPKPAYGRIPNFEGAEEAAEKLFNQPEYGGAEVVKVNPDAPQHSVRAKVLSDGKVLIIPTPRLKSGFLLLDPRRISSRMHAEASTIRGSFRYGRICPLDEMPKIDLIVVGSVAVSRDGVRLGKGGGYGEIEYAVLREIGSVGEETPIFTTVHDVQIVDHLPKEEHDLVVDVILTPTRILRTENKQEKPKGILWEKITAYQLREMPILSELKDLRMGAKVG
jgi:5-formyltetrahydrofolate cyclo-ligase